MYYLDSDREEAVTQRGAAAGRSIPTETDGSDDEGDWDEESGSDDYDFTEDVSEEVEEEEESDQGEPPAVSYVCLCWVEVVAYVVYLWWTLVVLRRSCLCRTPAPSSTPSTLSLTCVSLQMMEVMMRNRART